MLWGVECFYYSSAGDVVRGEVSRPSLCSDWRTPSSHTGACCLSVAFWLNMWSLLVNKIILSFIVTNSSIFSRVSPSSAAWLQPAPDHKLLSLTLNLLTFRHHGSTLSQSASNSRPFLQSEQEIIYSFPALPLLPLSPKIIRSLSALPLLNQKILNLLALPLLSLRIIRNLSVLPLLSLRTLKSLSALILWSLRMKKK